jgi:polyamine oxidase
MSLVADAVVVTVPLGVLKTPSIDFTPPLPRRKRRAIQRLGCASTMKMAMKFPSVFWPAKQFIGLVGASVDIFGDGDHIEIVNSHYFHKNRVLIFEMEGAFAEGLSAMSDTDRTAMVMAAVRRAFPSAPEPSGVLTNNYVASPYTRCGFSYWPVGASGDDNLEVGGSVGGAHGDRILFGGEHTTAEFYANLHGAVEEGRRVAADVDARGGLLQRVVGSLLGGGDGLVASMVGGVAKRTKKFRPTWCPAPCQ